MTSSDDTNQKDAANAANSDKDRRVNTRLRVAFESACQITAPFFDSEKGWGSTPLTMYAQQALREAYPELTQQDIAILLVSVQRFHRK